MSSRILTAFCIFLIVSGNNCLARIEKEIEKEFDVKKDGTLTLDVDVGSVRVGSHSKDRVLINVILYAKTSRDREAQEIFDNYDLSFDNDGEDVSVEGEILHRRFWSNSRLWAEFEVTVPQEYNLMVNTSGGSIDVDDILGQVNVKTSGGRINLGKIHGEVVARTSGGGISLESSSGSASLYTSGGGINIGRVEGDVDARTSGGSINVDAVAGDVKVSSSGGGLRLMNVSGNLSGKTSGGPIVAELTRQIDGRIELRTSGGGIRLSVPRNFNADIDAVTSGGNVSTELPIKVIGKLSSSRLTGKLNNGGPEVYLRTSGGSIQINEN